MKKKTCRIGPLNSLAYPSETVFTAPPASASPAGLVRKCEADRPGAPGTVADNPSSRSDGFRTDVRYRRRY